MSNLLRLVACLFLCVSLNSFGALYDRGNGLIYDDVLDVTWMQDANYAQTSGFSDLYEGEGDYCYEDYYCSGNVQSNGGMGQGATSLYGRVVIYGGYGDWGLPSFGGPAIGGDHEWSVDIEPSASELGHMFFNNLGNTVEGGLTNTSFIDGATGLTVSLLNVQTGRYWYGQELCLSHAGCGELGSWVSFDMLEGEYRLNPSYLSNFVWLVRQGDSIGLGPIEPHFQIEPHLNEVPLPAGIYLFLSGLVGLGLMRGRNA